MKQENNIQKISYILKNIQVIEFKTNSLKTTDILIENDEIKLIKDRISVRKSKNVKIIDCKNKYLLPKITDLNLTPKDGKLSENSIKTLISKSVKNGIQNLAIMPQISPQIDSEANLTLLTSLVKEASNKINFLPVISATNEKNELTNISTLINFDKKPFRPAIYLQSDINRNILRRSFEYAKMQNSVIFCEIHDDELNDNGVLHNSENAFKLGLPTRHQLGEIIQVAKIIEMARFYDVTVIFQSITEQRAIEEILKAKKEGVSVFIELSIHHLIFNDEIYSDFNSYKKIEPPFQTETTRKYLIETLKSGGIDFLTSLHKEVSEFLKGGSFQEAEAGIDSLDSLLSIYYTYLVKNETIDFVELFKYILINQNNLMNIQSQKIEIETGSKIDDFNFFDTEIEVKINNKNSIYFDEKLFGEIINFNNLK